MENTFIEHAIFSLMGYSQYRCGGNDLVRRALDQAARSHRMMFRDGGEPYIVHCVRVATHLISFAEEPLRQQDIAVALLHDVLEDDPEMTKKQLALAFGSGIAEGVDVLSKRWKTGGKDVTADQYHSQLLASPALVRLTKLCDRFDNLLSLYSCPDLAKVKRYLPATETFFEALGKGTNPKLWGLILEEVGRIRLWCESK